MRSVTSARASVISVWRASPRGWGEAAGGVGGDEPGVGEAVGEGAQGLGGDGAAPGQQPLETGAAERLAVGGQGAQRDPLAEVESVPLEEDVEHGAGGVVGAADVLAGEWGWRTGHGSAPVPVVGAEKGVQGVRELGGGRGAQSPEGRGQFLVELPYDGDGPDGHVGALVGEGELDRAGVVGVGVAAYEAAWPPGCGRASRRRSAPGPCGRRARADWAAGRPGSCRAATPGASTARG